MYKYHTSFVNLVSELGSCLHFGLEINTKSDHSNNNSKGEQTHSVKSVVTKRHGKKLKSFVLDFHTVQKSVAELRKLKSQSVYINRAKIVQNLSCREARGECKPSS